MMRSMLVVSLLVLSSCRDDTRARAAQATGGNPDRGRDGAIHHGCASCHTIPGVPGAHALVGPPLDHMARRSYIAGTLPNSPANMQEWILHPQKVKPNNAMPEVPMTDEDARDLTAYMYTLE